MQKVIFGCYGSKIKISVLVKNDRSMKIVKERAWQEFSRIMRMPVSKLKRNYCLMGRNCHLVAKSSIWIS